MLRKITKLINELFDFLEKCISMLRTIFFAARLLVMKERTKFTDKYEKNVLILANGPSVQELDVSKLLHEVDDVVCMNWYALNEELFRQIRPSYYCLADAVFYDDIEEFREKKEKLFKILEKAEWDIKYICPCGLKLPFNDARQSYIWINNNVFYGEKFKRLTHWLYRKNLASCGMETVALCPLYYFLSLKAKNIYLAGIDMSEFKGYIINENNEIYLESKHFYGTTRTRQDGDGLIKKGEFYKLFGSYYRMLEEFYYIAKYAKAQNVNVVNVSVNSFVDVFKKDSSFIKG